jgi:hypothetical protein
MLRMVTSGKPFDADAAVHPVGGFFAVFVHAVQRVEHRGHHRHRAQPRIVQDFVVKLLVGGAAVNGERDRNHFRLLVELAHDAGVAILHEAPTVSVVFTILKAFSGEGSVASTSPCSWAGRPMPNCSSGWPQASKPLRIDVSHGASGGNVHIAAHQNGAYGGAGLRAAPAAWRR